MRAFKCLQIEVIVTQFSLLIYAHSMHPGIFLSGPISQQGFLISTFNVVDYHVDTGRWTIFWSLTRAEYACTWRAPISETGIALLKDDFDRLIGDRMHYDMKDAFANPAKWSLIKPF